MPTMTFALTAQGRDLDMSPEAWGRLRASTDIVDDATALRARMKAEGYLYLPGLLNRAEVLEARRTVTERLLAAGHLDPASPPMQAIAPPDTEVSFQPDARKDRNVPEVAKDNAELFKVLYTGPMIEFFTRFLGGPVRHYDFTWFRAVAPGAGSLPHCDLPYMGRGTHNLYTAWTPIGDVDFAQGGLIVLEESPKHVGRLRAYLNRDVDTYCVNGPYAQAIETGKRKWGAFDGVLGKDPVELREKFGGRWLSTEFSAGDVLIFSVYTIHASLDNHSRHVRLSSDTRYQLASEPVDDRWVGENPAGHGVAGKRGRIC